MERDVTAASAPHDDSHKPRTIQIQKEIHIQIQIQIIQTRSPEMNRAPDINNHLRSIDLFRSMINDQNKWFAGIVFFVKYPNP